MTRVIDVNRTCKVTKGGGIMSITALVVVGNGDGIIGFATGKGKDVGLAIEKAYTVGAALFTTFLRSKHQMTTPSMAHVTNLTPPGSDNPRRECSKAPVDDSQCGPCTNLLTTPGSEGSATLSNARDSQPGVRGALREEHHLPRGGGEALQDEDHHEAEEGGGRVEVQPSH